MKSTTTPKVEKITEIMSRPYLKRCYFVVELKPSITFSSSTISPSSSSFLGDKNIFENRNILRQFWIDNMLQFGDKRRNIYSTYSTLCKLLMTPEMQRLKNDNSTLFHVFR